MIDCTMTFQPETIYQDLKSANDVAKLLEKTRSNLGITIEKASDETKIRKVWLNCIETGNFDKLPGTVYAIGFSRTYATYLGLAPDIIVKTLQTSTDFFQQQKEVLSVPQNEKILTPKVTFFISLILVFSIIFGFSYFMNKNISSEGYKTTENSSTPRSQAQMHELDDDFTD